MHALQTIIILILSDEVRNWLNKGRTIRKVMGAGGVGKKKQKKFMQGKLTRKKFVQRRR